MFKISLKTVVGLVVSIILGLHIGLIHPSLSAQTLVLNSQSTHTTSAHLSPAQNTSLPPTQTIRAVQHKKKIAPSVVFFDLNNAQAEIATIKRSLPPESEITVLPSMQRIYNEQRAKVYALGAQLVQIEKQIDKHAVHCSAKPNDALCQKNWQMLRQVEDARLAIVGNQVVESFQQDLETVQRPFDILVISGHHFDGHFSGELASLDVPELRQIMAARPSLFAQVRTVLLLGCDTTIDDLLRTTFRPLFPHATLLVGAEGPAPTRELPHNLSFIQKFMQQEAQLVKAENEQTIRKEVANLRKELWPVAILWGDIYSAGTDTEHLMPLAKLQKIKNQAKKGAKN